jgi:hypothetical protein
LKNKNINDYYPFSRVLNQQIKCIGEQTLEPTDSISPANSNPKMDYLGFLKPNKSPTGIQSSGGNSNFRILGSSVLTVVARTFISTSLFFGAGLGTSFILRTLGAPYSVYTIAFINPFGTKNLLISK